MSFWRTWDSGPAPRSANYWTRFRMSRSSGNIASREQALHLARKLVHRELRGREHNHDSRQPENH